MALTKNHPSIPTETPITALSPYGSLDDHDELELENGGQFTKNLAMMATHCASSSSKNCSSSTNSMTFAFHSTEEDQSSLINFRGSSPGHETFNVHSFNGPLLDFQQNDQYHNVNQVTNSTYIPDDHHDHDKSSCLIGNYHWNQIGLKIGSLSPRILQDFNCFQTANGLDSIGNCNDKESHGNWLFAEANIVIDHSQDALGPQGLSHKRPNTGGSTQVTKKQCNNATRKAKTNKKPSSTPPSKDTQSVAAKNRRERISERLKILQDLVPSGSKVDLVTMLEKAISYVKFLQLQVKVLATDEFWPAQGGKAPDINQVKEAIDAILASQRDRNSSSRSK